ncbi:MAG: hypothetical protein JSS20_04735 [Proteobacteria bacterium]|nr:hypothetical protein [Pseudomonadota bacterium]
MATTGAAVICALLALVLWVPIGWLTARRLSLGPALEIAAAPILGWALQGITVFWVGSFAGFSVTTVAVSTLLMLAGLAAWPGEPNDRGEFGILSLPGWAVAGVALLALGPAIAIVPKTVSNGIALAAPIFDHSKIALIDEIVRTGLPAANPFIGTGDAEPGSIAYYFFWQVGAAQLALMSGASGWEADIAATWFSAFASLLLMCGLAFRFAEGRRSSVAFVLAAALGGSLRPVLAAVFGEAPLGLVLAPASGLGGWLFQSSWSPHHVAAAAAVMLALLIARELPRRASAGRVAALGGLAAAAYASSIWVGGVTFVFCAGVAATMLLARADSHERRRLAVAAASAILLAVILVAPLLREQMRAAAARGDLFPVAIAPFPVLGSAVPPGLRPLLDLPAYGPILLLVEFPAILVLGSAGAWRDPRREAGPLVAAALASLATGALLVSTAGDNNDLGWRAVLPAVIILTAFAGAQWAHLFAGRRFLACLGGLALLLLALPDGLGILTRNARGYVSRDASRFARAPAMWAAVRQYSRPDERVASNPHMTGDLVPWPISLSWSLLSNRRSCYAGDELVTVFGKLPPRQRKATSALFDKAFAGTATAGDLSELIGTYHCRVVLLTPEDGAWTRDVFASSALFDLVAQTDGKWRIYRARIRSSALR